METGREFVGTVDAAAKGGGVLLRSYGVVIAALVGVVGLLLLVHGYLGSDWPGAGLARSVYVYRHGSRQNWPWVDIAVPMLVLTVVTYKNLYRYHFLHVLVAIVVQLAVLVQLLEVYARGVSPSVCYWWPRGGADEAVQFMIGRFFDWVFFFGLAGLVMRYGERKAAGNNGE